MKRSKSKGVYFDFKRFLIFLIVGFICALAWVIWKEASIPTSKNMESVYVKTISQKELPTHESIDSNENSIENKIRSRQAYARSVFESDNGILYVDESYGGNSSPTDSETPIARMSIPSLKMDRDIWVGIGQNPNRLSGSGDDDRLYKAVTYRANQTLGGDNFTVVSHIWNGESLGRDFSSEWFSPLLNSVDGGMTTDLSKIRLQKGDKILVEEFSTGLLFEFEVGDIRAENKSGLDGFITPKVKSLLSARIDRPRITLQGCLMNTDKLVFVVAELKEVSRGSETWSFTD